MKRSILCLILLSMTNLIGSEPSPTVDQDGYLIPGIPTTSTTSVIIKTIFPRNHEEAIAWHSLNMRHIYDCEIPMPVSINNQKAVNEELAKFSPNPMTGKWEDEVARRSWLIRRLQLCDITPRYGQPYTPTDEESRMVDPRSPREILEPYTKYYYEYYKQHGNTRFVKGAIKPSDPPTADFYNIWKYIDPIESCFGIKVPQTATTATRVFYTDAERLAMFRRGYVTEPPSAFVPPNISDQQISEGVNYCLSRGIIAGTQVDGSATLFIVPLDSPEFLARQSLNAEENPMTFRRNLGVDVYGRNPQGVGIISGVNYALIPVEESSQPTLAQLYIEKHFPFQRDEKRFIKPEFWFLNQTGSISGRKYDKMWNQVPRPSLWKPYYSLPVREYFERYTFKEVSTWPPLCSTLVPTGRFRLVFWTGRGDKCIQSSVITIGQGHVVVCGIRIQDLLDITVTKPPRYGDLHPLNVLLIEQKQGDLFVDMSRFGTLPDDLLIGIGLAPITKSDTIPNLAKYQSHPTLWLAWAQQKLVFTRKELLTLARVPKDQMEQPLKFRLFVRSMYGRDVEQGRWESPSSCDPIDLPVYDPTKGDCVIMKPMEILGNPWLDEKPDSNSRLKYGPIPGKSK